MTYEECIKELRARLKKLESMTSNRHIEARKRKIQRVLGDYRAEAIERGELAALHHVGEYFGDDS